MKTQVQEGPGDCYAHAKAQGDAQKHVPAQGGAAASVA